MALKDEENYVDLNFIQSTIFNNITQMINESKVCKSVNDDLRENFNDVTTQPLIMIIFSIFYLIIIIVGVVGNSLVIISVLQNKILQSVRNFFIVALSCSDIIVCVVSGSFTPISAFSKTWLFGEFLCKLVPFIQGVSLFFSTFILASIAVDRFILIIFPTTQPISKKLAIVMIISYIFIGSILTKPIYDENTLESYKDYCGKICYEKWNGNEDGRKRYGTIVFIVQMVIPFIIISACYIMISLKLKKRITVKKEDEAFKSLSKAGTRRTNKNRRQRTNRMLMAMVLVFVFCWTPTVAFNFLRDYQKLPIFIQKQEYLFGILTHFISISSTVWNPCLYALLNVQFRTAFSQILGHTTSVTLNERKNLEMKKSKLDILKTGKNNLKERKKLDALSSSTKNEKSNNENEGCIEYVSYD
ncbi:Prolactin-releasing peptide receptor [Strongyloides ratti]|uniref:Prolactin-releasing peptide receptor n=1 Tax=Strongyloides ratti TaxID=34506 RepID=A0A090MWT3_STRRB|nr:Prolactin-releasing peptide receptor [Strongyloides ratti]CEF64234.1 Prolactin-releasing peptide receptor [Strongyloides ratti]